MSNRAFQLGLYVTTEYLERPRCNDECRKSDRSEFNRTCLRDNIYISVCTALQRNSGEGVKKGMTYGILVWLVGALTGIASMPFYMTIATTVVVYWLLQALVLGLINGAIVGVIYKE
jgi:hypothetical protein